MTVLQIKRLKGKRKDLVASIAAAEKVVKNAEKWEPKLEAKKEELEKYQAKLEALCPPKAKKEE